MINIYHNTVTQRKLRKVKDFVSFSWISLVRPDTEEVKKISKLLNLPLDAFEDSLDEFELPRVRVVGRNAIIILRAGIESDKGYKTTPLTIILSEKHITTIVREENGIIDDLTREKIEVYTTQQSNFFIKISMRIIDNYQKYINVINRSVQNKKTNLNNIRKNDILTLVENEEILNNFAASLSPTISTIKKILQHNYINLYHQDKELMNDLLIDGEQVLELCLTNLKTIKNVRDGYTTAMSIDMNLTVQMLTYITAIFTIPMVVASTYGMNIRLPLASRDDTFFILAGGTVALIIIMMLIFFYIRKKS